MSKICISVIAIIVLCFAGSAHCFNAEKQSMNIIQMLKDNDTIGVYRLSDTYKKDEKQLKSLKSFQRDQKRDEQVKQYQYNHKSLTEIINGSAFVQFLELQKKRLRNGKVNYVAYYSLAYDNADTAGTDYNRKIKKCVIAVSIQNNLFNSLSVMDNPAPEYW
jgi:hypothetical protein